MTLARHELAVVSSQSLAASEPMGAVVVTWAIERKNHLPKSLRVVKGTCSLGVQIVVNLGAEEEPASG